MARRRRLLPVAAALFALGLMPAACGGGSDTEAAAGGPRVIVGSRASTESAMLAQIYGGALENAGADVVYKLKQGSGPALESGAIDMMPEHVGSFLTFLGRTETTGLTLADAVAMTRSLAKAKNLTVGEASEAAGGEVLAVTKDLANREGLAKISDLKKLGAFTLAGPTECGTRDTCLLGLRSTYGLTGVTLLPAGADAGGPVTKKALTDGKAQVGRLLSSDPDLAKAGKYVVLEDDLHYQQAGNVIPVIRTAKATDAMVDVLDRVSRSLTHDELLELNKRTETDKEDPAKVAADFVLAHRL